MSSIIIDKNHHILLLLLFLNILYLKYTYLLTPPYVKKGFTKNLTTKKNLP